MHFSRSALRLLERETFREKRRFRLITTRTTEGRRIVALFGATSPLQGYPRNSFAISCCVAEGGTTTPALTINYQLYGKTHSTGRSLATGFFRGTREKLLAVE